MSIIRVQKRDRYKSISHVPLNDPRLTWAARGVLLHLLGQADNWEVRLTALVNRGKGASRDKIYKIFRELQKLGYCKRNPVRKCNGQLDGWDYAIFEEPISETPSPSDASSQLRQNRDTAAPHSVWPVTGGTDTNYKEVITTINRDKELTINNWLPNQDVLTILETYGIHQEFAEAAIPEFIFYWREKDACISTWSSKFIAHIRRQWVRHKNVSEPQTIEANWQPNEDFYDILRDSNIDITFAHEQIAEFILFWRDAGTPQHSWNAKFLQHIKHRWHARFTNDATNHLASTFEQLNDRSWAESLHEEQDETAPHLISSRQLSD